MQPLLLKSIVKKSVEKKLIKKNINQCCRFSKKKKSKNQSCLPKIIIDLKTNQKLERLKIE